MTTEKPMPELEQLKDITQLYLKLSGYTPQLCQYLVKVIDFLDDAVNSAVDPAEVAWLNGKMLQALGAAVAEHTDNTRLRSSVEWAANRQPDQSVCAILLADIWGAVSGNNLGDQGAPRGLHQE